MASYDIRVFGDPVLRQRATEIADIDEGVRRLAHDMIETMYAAPGVGLAAPQVGVQRRIFVYDAHDETGPHVVINPALDDHSGEWTYEEGCLSVPGLYWPIVRAKEVHLTGVDLDGNELSIHADELQARIFRRRARGADLLPTPVKAAAHELGLAVSDRVDDVLDAGAELGVVVAFGRLIRPHVLDRLSMVNLHFSLLPRWRGAAPVERAILAGDSETGVCLMALEEGLDTGPVYACQRVEIDPEETAPELRTRLVGVGAAMVVERLAGGPAG